VRYDRPVSAPLTSLPAARAHALRFAAVAVNAGQPARTPFSYAVPPELDVRVGQAVFVPFGSRILQGIVLALETTPEVEDVRPIAAVADPEPVLDETHIGVARWLSETYLAPLWDCIAVSLPPGYGQKSVTMVSPVDVPLLLPIDPVDQRILQHIAAHGRVTLDALREAVGTVTMARLQRLQLGGHLTVAQGLASPSGKPRFTRMLEALRSAPELEAHASALEAARPQSIEARILRAAAGGNLPLGEARALGATPAHVRHLEEGGWLRATEVQVERNPVDAYTFGELPALVLSSDQQAAADAIAANPGRTHLLHGVTGSGKTEVYLDLVARVLAAGKGAIVLVPEIALTPQAIRRFGERFGETLAVRHSALSGGEAYDQWYRIQRGEARLVLGSRSALFSPVKDLGLVVLDEEHEWSYKQVEPQPRYHARAAAEQLRQLTGATLVLGSATPDVTTYQRSEAGSILRHELVERINPASDGSTATGTMPSISVIDMREELKNGNRTVFGFALKRAVDKALVAGEQSILFVNRRGSARFTLCRDCGYVPVCPSCDVAMGLDLAEPIQARLRCHHCGRSRRLEERCPKCGGNRYRPFGVGTQRIEQEARTHFPGARVARWDSDVSRHKGSHEAIVAALERREIDILVGTQMLAKGLDLPAMTVVGVVDADVGLSLPDFSAHERTFQVLSQVAGRAGRREKAGSVFIQTYDPEAPPIVCAADHDYRSFFEHEIAHRRRAGYPPFGRLARLLFHHGNDEHALQEAARVATDLRLRRDTAGRADPDILGPSRAFIPRLRGDYRWQIVLRGRNPGALIGSVRLGERWSVDVDPATLL